MTERERAVALYTFLKEFAQLRTKMIRQISEYKRHGQVIWASEIPRESGCYCIAWNRDTSATSDEVWLEIRKHRLVDPPEPPDILWPWLPRRQLRDSSLEFPELDNSIRGEQDGDTRLSLDDHPEVSNAWETYVEDAWWGWAEQDRREQEVAKVYSDLFSMFQRQQRLGENFEVVFGLGLLAWKPAQEPAVRRHLVAARVSITFDRASGTLTVVPAGEGAHPSLEQDMLDPQSQPDSETLKSIEASLEEMGDSLWEKKALDEELSSWVNSLSPDGEYSPVLERPKRESSKPVVHLAPALIMRRRTEISFIRAFETIIGQLETGEEPVPKGVSTFVTVSEDPASAGAPDEDRNGSGPSETFFPLPVNEQQLQIVERLTSSQGVLVQGPPGTGKSHTIVNLICHILAGGQRVLVTSHTVRALKVLQNMIRDQVPNLAPLAVVLLGDDRAALQAMEESVQGITTRRNRWDPAASRRKMRELEKELDNARKSQAEALAELRAIREKETLEHDRFGYAGTLARIADTLYTEKDQLSWIPDDILVGTDPPSTVAEFTELVALLRDERVSKWEAAGWSSIDTDPLPTAEQFRHNVEAERKEQQAYEQRSSIRKRPEYAALRGLSEDHRQELMEGLDGVFRLLQRIDRRQLPWATTAVKQILGGLDGTWRSLLKDTRDTPESTEKPVEWLDRHEISPQPSTELQSLLGDAEDLLAHFEGGGRWGFGPFRAAVVKRTLDIRDMRVGGHPCETPDILSHLVARLRDEIRFKALRDRWAPHHAITATNFADQVAQLEDLCEPLKEAFETLAITKELSGLLSRTATKLDPNWSDPDDLRLLRDILVAIESTRRYEAARSRIDRTLDELRAQGQHRQLDPTEGELKAAVTERDTATYADALKRAVENRQLEAMLVRRVKLLRRLQGVAPGLAKLLVQTADDPVWDERAPNFERAWNWSRARGWVGHLAAPDTEHDLRLQLGNVKKRIADRLERLAAEKAWSHCFERMTEKERQYLVAWAKAVRAIGKGTGKYAHIHRRNARRHLNECRSAIPAWVMPLHRVAETITPGSELFDIAIVDEASQSGPEALLLSYLAKKVVVVGDDKQIHPTYAGINYKDVNQLRERYISDLPLADIYGVDNSFFDLAEIRYGHRIRLREHFRCMPEIIQFSNNLSYEGEPLIPLRQYGAGRLEPTIEVRHVADGYLKGTGARQVNPPEADAIVAAIVAAHDNPAYEGKTMGVISLVGDGQAREIEQRLVRKLGPENIENRQIVCGNAYAFQGDERDVMFLSMVSAPQEGRRIRALASNPDQRRFNVAASRARDQLFLFHTATLADLSPSCMRYQLLEYCTDPKVAIPDVSGLDIPQLDNLAARADRQVVQPPDPFDSWFELDVFLRIARRGYRVIPQFEVGGYRIDLVVQGLEGSLAVECDGDFWHGPDRYEADVARQRDLERCGWEFWRIREGVFRLDPDQALDDLWKTLERRHVFPTAEEKRRRRTPSREKRSEGISGGKHNQPPPPEPQETHQSLKPPDRPAPTSHQEPAAPSRPRLRKVRFTADRDRAKDVEPEPTPSAGPQLPTPPTRPSEDTDEWLASLYAWSSLEKRQLFPTAEEQKNPGTTSSAGTSDVTGHRKQHTGPGKVRQPRQPSDRPTSAKDPEPGPPRPSRQRSRAVPARRSKDRDDWLAPYTEWKARGPVPDPRTADKNQLIELLAEVAEREGPVVAERAYRLIDRASGSERFTKQARSALNKARHAAEIQGYLTATNLLNRPRMADHVLQSPSRTGRIVPREPGPRQQPEELPPEEIVEMMKRLIEQGDPAHPTILKRLVAEKLRWERITRKRDEFLDRCIELLGLLD